MKIWLFFPLLLFSALVAGEEITGNLSIGSHENTTLVIIVTEAQGTNTNYSIVIQPETVWINATQAFNITLEIYDSFGQRKMNFTESNLTVWIYHPDTKKTYYLKNMTNDKISFSSNATSYVVSVSQIDSNIVGGFFRLYFKVKDYLNVTGENYSSLNINESYIHFWWVDAPKDIYTDQKDTWLFRVKNYGHKSETVNISVTTEDCLSIDFSSASPTANSITSGIEFRGQQIGPTDTKEFSFSVIGKKEAECAYTIKLSNGHYWVDGFASTQTITDTIDIFTRAEETQTTAQTNATQNKTDEIEIIYFIPKVSIVQGGNRTFFISLNNTGNETLINVSLSLSLNNSMYSVEPKKIEMVPGNRTVFTITLFIPIDYQLGDHVIGVKVNSGTVLKKKFSFELEVLPNEESIQRIIDLYYVYMEKLGRYRTKAKEFDSQGKSTGVLWFYINISSQKLDEIREYINKEEFLEAYRTEQIVERYFEEIEKEVKRLEKSVPIEVSSFNIILIIILIVIAIVLVYLFWPVREEHEERIYKYFLTRKKEGLIDKIKKWLKWKKKPF